VDDKLYVYFIVKEKLFLLHAKEETLPIQETKQRLQICERTCQNKNICVCERERHGETLFIWVLNLLMYLRRLKSSKLICGL
jgi:hypothetical protein